MAKRLRNWPGGLVVCDARVEATEPFVAKGAVAVANGAAVADRASVICVMVQNSEQVRAVLEGPHGILATALPGTVVAVHSTVSAESAIELAELAAASQVELVDAPVSGGVMGAYGGTLAIMVGGSEGAVAKCRPVFDRLATLTQHMGPVGAGTHTKIARNLISFVGFAVVGEAQRLAEAAGLDIAKLGEVVRHSDAITGGAGAIMIRDSGRVMDPADGLRSIFGHTATLGDKDLTLAIQMGQELGCKVPFAELGLENLRSALGLEPPPSPSQSLS